MRFSVFCILLLCLGAACSDKKTSHLHSSSFTDAQGQKAVKVEDKTDYYQLYLKYPIFHTQNKYCDSLNAIIKAMMIEERRIFRSNAMQICNSEMESSAELPHYENDFTIIFQNEKLISIRFSIYIDWGYTLEANHYYKTLNFKLNSGKEIKISDFLQQNFKSRDEGIEVLSKICKEKLYNEKELECNSFWNAQQDLEVFELMNLTDKELVLIFDDYILDNKACGNPEVRIPLEKLRGNSTQYLKTTLPIFEKRLSLNNNCLYVIF